MEGEINKVIVCNIHSGEMSRSFNRYFSHLYSQAYYKSVSTNLTTFQFNLFNPHPQTFWGGIVKL